MKRLFRFWYWSALAGTALSVGALIMLPFSIEELAGESDLVVQGRILSLTVQRDPERRIYTELQVAVAEVWKGTLDPDFPLEVVHGGGTLGTRRQAVSGQAEYRPGEEVVLFLVRNPRGQAVTLGLAQGKFELFRDPESGEKLARNVFHGTGRGGAAQQGNPGRAARLTLAELKQQVTARDR